MRRILDIKSARRNNYDCVSCNNIGHNNISNYKY